MVGDLLDQLVDRPIEAGSGVPQLIAGFDQLDAELTQPSECVGVSLVLGLHPLSESGPIAEDPPPERGIRSGDGQEGDDH